MFRIRYIKSLNLGIPNLFWNGFQAWNLGTNLPNGIKAELIKHVCICHVVFWVTVISTQEIPPSSVIFLHVQIMGITVMTPLMWFSACLYGGVSVYVCVWVCFERENVFGCTYNPPLPPATPPIPLRPNNGTLKETTARTPPQPMAIWSGKTWLAARFKLFSPAWLWAASRGPLS